MNQNGAILHKVFLTTLVFICVLPAFSYAQCTTEFDGATQVATSYGDMLTLEGYSTTTPNALFFGLYYFLGGPSAPGIYRLEDDPVNGNYSTCNTCILVWDVTGPAERIFFATAGELNIQSIGPPGISFSGTLSNVNLIEVTIDWQTFVSTPVPGGETQCIETFSFDTPIQGTTMDSDGDGLSDNDELDIYGTDPQNPDTDGGGVGDGQEVLVDGTNPLNPADDLLPIDADGDGYPLTVDCNDADPTINPGAQEIWYDGIDQNCDGRNDYDQDGDGFVLGEDCDDTNPLMSPSISVDSCDGFDNDCDGQIDEDRQGSCIAVHLTWQTPGDPILTDNAGTDLDLHFVHPTGDWFVAKWDCFWQNKNPNWGDPMSVLDDPSLDIDDTNGVGPEVISLEYPEAGAVYKVGVHYFSDHGFGSSYAAVKIFFNGSPVFEEAGKVLNVREFWEVATVDWETGTVTPIGIVKPAVLDDVTVTVVNTRVSIDVLSNDGSPGGNPLFVHSFDTLSHYGGTVSCDTTVTTPTPQCTYTPPTGLIETDFFTYDATDGSSVSLRAYVHVEVTPLPGQCLELYPPDIVNFGAVEIGTSSSQDVFLVNCGTVPITVESVAIVDDPAGAFSIISAPPLPRTLPPSEGDGIYIEYHPPDASRHSALLRIQTEAGGFRLYLSGIGLPGVNEFPYPFDDTAITTSDTLFPVAIDVLANDYDPDRDTLYINSFDVVSAHGGSVSCNTGITTPGPQCIYTPPAKFSGTDTFTYDVTDGTEVSPVRAVVTIEVYMSHPAEWVALYNGTGNDYDNAYAIAVDEGGNVYVTGSSSNAGSGTDFVTVSYDPEGNERWVARYNGPANMNDNATTVAVGPSGIIYVAGDSQSETGWDIAIVAYDRDGHELWTAQYDGPAGGPDHTAVMAGSSGIAVDLNGNVAVAGMSWGGNTGYDYVTLSYDAGGNERWVARYNGTRNENDGASSIAVDEYGNVYVTGLSNFPHETGTPLPAPFFPGIMTSYQYGDYATVAYDSSGNQLWVAVYNNNCGQGCDCGDDARSVKVGSAGLIYVTGTSRGKIPPEYGCEVLGAIDYATIAYDQQGNEVWVARKNVQPELAFATDMAVDASGNVYVTGYVTDIESRTKDDFLTVAYDAAGNERWAARSGFEKFHENPSSIAVDALGNIYVTGNIVHENYEVGSDIFTVAYDAEGNERWIGIVDGPGNLRDDANDVVVDRWGNVYLAGVSGWYFGENGRPDWSEAGYITVKYAAEDRDRDGIPDTVDQCPVSDLSPFIVIAGCDTGVQNGLSSDGCTRSDMIGQCAEGAKNHGAFVVCVSHLADSWKASGLISGREQGAIMSCAAQSDIP